MDRSHRCLQLEGAQRTGRERTLHQGGALRDLRGVPQRPVLLGEGDQPTVRIHSGTATRVLQEQEREQPKGLRVVRRQVGEQPREAYALRAQLPAHRFVARRGRVALVEDQVDDMQRGRQPCGQLVTLGQPERDAGHSDLALGAHHPLGHRGLGNQEGCGHLSRREPAYGAQREGDLRILGQGRVAAEQDQLELVVRQRPSVVGVETRDVVGAGGRGRLVALAQAEGVGLLARAGGVRAARGRAHGCGPQS